MTRHVRPGRFPRLQRALVNCIADMHGYFCLLRRRKSPFRFAASARSSLRCSSTIRTVSAQASGGGEHDDHEDDEDHDDDEEHDDD